MVVQDRNPFRPGWNLRLDWHGEIRKRPHFWCIGAEPAGTPRASPTRGIWPRTVVFPLAQVSGLAPQIQNVNVRPQPRVIHQVPPLMIRIRIEHEVVGIPLPVAHAVVIVRRHLEEVPADVEPVAPAAAQPPDLRRANGPLEPAMLLRMIEMVVRIIASRVVPYPTVILRMVAR